MIVQAFCDGRPVKIWVDDKDVSYDSKGQLHVNGMRTTTRQQREARKALVI